MSIKNSSSKLSIMNKPTKKLLFVVSCCILIVFTAICQSQAQNKYKVIPYPSSMTENEGEFVFAKKMGISIVKDVKYTEILLLFIQQFKAVSGIELSINSKEKQGIVVKINPNIADEGYQLTVTKKDVTIEVASPAGLFYSLATLRQLLPNEIFASKYQNIKWAIPCVKISDAPAFGYRGALLDVSRHFMPVEFVCKFIDLLAQYKMNRFHWHLTDDQGWRIEIKKYPLLTTVGSIRRETLVGHGKSKPRVFDCTEYKGYYTQDEIKQVVAYAQKRFITIIPEIDIPGHSLAALAAYPALGCSGGPYEMGTYWGVFNDVLCPKDTTIRFYENVLSEIIDLFPSKYIHIGGDECPKIRWKNCAHCQQLIKEKGLKDEHQLQCYFMTKIEGFVNSKGRSIIGWDEMLDGGLTPNATIMSWRNEKGGIKAARSNHNTIMCPNKYCYLDHYQEPKDKAPLAFGGDTPLKAVYDYNPIPDTLEVDKRKYIQGVEACLWTEYLPTGKQVEYMSFPRMTAIAEVGWTPSEKKNWDNFYSRLQTEFIRFDLMGVNACQFERKTKK